jgi:hypothetical protein
MRGGGPRAAAAPAAGRTDRASSRISKAMQTLFALTPAESYTIAAVAVWFVIFPAFVTGLIAFAVAGVLRERVENEEEVARRKRG